MTSLVFFLLFYPKSKIVSFFLFSNSRRQQHQAAAATAAAVSSRQQDPHPQPSFPFLPKPPAAVMADDNEEMEIDEPSTSGGERKRFEVKKVRSHP